MSTEAPAPFEITDPTGTPTYGDGPISRWCRRSLYEARDEVFVRLTLQTIALQSAAMVALYITVRRELIPAWIAMAAYLTVWGWFTPPVILMLHNTMHRPFIRNPRFLDRAHTYVMSFFHGIPTGYQDHHLGMHHVEDNMRSDLSSTMRYRRDSFLHFLVYFLRFFFLSIIELPLYLLRHRRYKMARRALAGELLHEALIVAAILLDWRFGLAAFAFPYVAVRFMMMTGNWGQHAFVNSARKNNGIANSITCINSAYNRRAFTDGYHIGHHLKASRHWTELPGDLMANREMYVREGAIVFEGIDFFMVSLFLWTGRWKLLAKHFVRLDGKPRSDEDVIAMLRSRVQPVREWPAESIGATA
ncbi:MAG: fatty acid desaturase [Deltaproteobacteria bacterium]